MSTIGQRSGVFVYHMVALATTGWLGYVYLDSADFRNRFPPALEVAAFVLGPRIAFRLLRR
ncbi:MAG: hypothetical protein ACYDCQ_01190 [Dehalococcoidia bacterium]